MTTTYGQRRIEELLADLEDSAGALERDAANLEGRGDPADHPDVAVRKRRAAQQVRDYADRLRTSPDDVNAAEVEKVARAARCGGILMDGRPQAEARAAMYGPHFEETRNALLSHAKADQEAIEGSDMFTHVVEEGQVPFYALSSYGGWYGHREPGHADAARDDCAEA